MDVVGQTDVLTMGIPFVCPYNPDSIMNPVLVMCMGLGYLFNMYRHKPLVREGGVVIMTHPTYRDFHPVHHPSYIDFFEQVLSDTTDPVTMQSKYEQRFAEDEWYKHLYRTGYAYHGVHPFYAWYWGAHGRDYAGDVIVVRRKPTLCSLYAAAASQGETRPPAWLSSSIENLEARVVTLPTADEISLPVNASSVVELLSR